MRKIMSWMLAATLVCGASVLNSCKDAHAQEDNPAPQVVSTEYVFPAGQKLGWHHHPVMNYGILVQGELTIIGLDGKTHVVHEGEAVVEMVGTVHHGENRGTKDCILYMFYLSQKDLPLAVQHPDIPLE